MRKTKKLVLVTNILFLIAGAVFAQASDSSLKPDFSVNVDFASGLQNLDGNKELEEIPGASSDYNASLNLLLKGMFSQDSEWAVEKTDGIEQRSGIGYEAGMTVDLASLYEQSSSTSSYSSGSDTNHYSLIQPMIDWYETNQVKYGLPADPCNCGSAWPTTSYGASTKRYQFIQGSTVENAADVNWTTQKWADAEALYQEIKYDISNAIDQLNADTFSTGDISQIAYASMSDSNKKLAELKMKAKREFQDVYNGKSTSTGNTILDAIDSAYIKITNIGGVVDTRIDFMGKRLSVGNQLYSVLAGQSTTGSAATVSLKKGLVEGLSASISAGIAGGEEQEAEDYDTASLDYYRGLSGELAAKGDVRYTKYFESAAGTLDVDCQGIMSDLIVTPYNFAVDASASYKANTFVNWNAGLEGMYLNWKDREADDAEYACAWAVAGNAGVGAYGIQLQCSGQYKSSKFSHKVYSSTEDRFYGYTAASDYYIATLNNAAMFKAQLDFNPQYFLCYDVVEISGGVDGFLYGTDLNGLGYFADLSVDLEDVCNLPVSVYGGFDYYKNSNMTEWDDYSTLPEQTFMEFTIVKAGISYSPVKYFTLACEYNSFPSYSRRDTARNSSVTINGQLKF